MNTIINQSILNQNSSLNHGSHKAIPSWIVWVQCSCFAVLYSIWYYPQTNFLSDLCMVIGAVLSLYVLFLNRSFFSAKESIPFWMLVALFGWIIFHLLFLSNNYPLQLREFTNIWKRVAIAIIFALGFGIALANSVPKKGYWVIFYLGMMMPIIIHLVKYILNNYSPVYGISVPEYLKIQKDNNSIFFIHKVYISAFCLPSLAISLAQLKFNFLQRSDLSLSNLIYITTFFNVLIIFYLENIKNGFVYSLILFLVFILLILINAFYSYKNRWFATSTLKSLSLKAAVIAFIFLATFQILTSHINKNPSWKSFLADSKVALEINQTDNWKYWGGKGYPLNEFGNPVSPTNYERVAWSVVSLKLLKENPKGFGLVENSFGYLTKSKWPDSGLSQSHSGWLDLALGIGVIGIVLVLGTIGLTIFISLRNAGQNNHCVSCYLWSTKVRWILIAYVLLWLTSEISLKYHLVSILFWTSLAIGLTWSPTKFKLNNLLK